MATPRKISTDKRETQLEKITEVLQKQGAKLDAIVADLGKPHVDDKASAKTLIATAKKLRKGLPA